MTIMSGLPSPKKMILTTLFEKYNQNHFRQANPTLFGQEGQLADTINPLNANNQVEDLLKGTFTSDLNPTLLLDSEQWISELQQKNTEETNLQLLPTNFVMNFKGM